MNSAFVGYEKLSRSLLLDLLNSSYPTQPHSLRADVSKYRPEVYKSEKSKILKKIHKVALGKLLT